MKPIIGITMECKRDPENLRNGGNLSLNWNYAQAVSDFGGVPLLVPPTADAAEVAKLIDGWLIPGGYDIDAKEFGQSNHPKSELQDPARFQSERSLLEAISPELPILGICYGCQFLNVTRGGDLIQHLPDVVGHENHTGGTLQEYFLNAGSKLSEIVGGTTAFGKSYHHQAIGDLGRGLSIVGRTEDGTIEAVEATDRPWVIGVQWHPERTIGDPESSRLFEAFIASAARYREAKSVAYR